MSKDITSTLLRIFLSERLEPFPFLESFAREYSQKVSEDKKTPLFSKTSKYNSFPVRCQWKSSEKVSQNHERRRKKDPKERLPQGNEVDGWRTSKQSERTNILKKADPFRSSIIKVLNKITQDNFRYQVDELLNVLNTTKNPQAVKIIADIILEKVWYDKSFYGIYVALCQKLWTNDDWISEGYKVFCSDGKPPQYYYILQLNSSKTPSLNGPFKTQEEAELVAKDRIHLRTVFLALCRDHFLRREEYISESNKLGDCNERYRLRRKLFGTVEIMGQFYKMGYLDESVIHYLFCSLLHTSPRIQEGAKFEEEIEAFHLLWNIVKDKLPLLSFKEYRKFLMKESSRWKSRTSFMIDDMIEFMGCRYLTKKIVIPQLQKKPDKLQVVETKFEDVKDKLLRMSRKEDLSEEIKDLLKKNKWQVDILTLLIRDSTEYGEFVDNHTKNLSLIINDKGFGVTISHLSEALSIIGEELMDIKLDAPKAPSNLAVIINSLKIDEGDMLNISITPTIADIEDEEFENELKAEWEDVIEMLNEDQREKINLFSMDRS